MRRRVEVAQHRQIHYFTDTYEERKGIEYVLNIIHSQLAGSSVEELFRVCSAMIGQDRFTKSLVQEYPEMDEEIGDNDWSRPCHRLGRSNSLSFLRRRCLPPLEKRMNQLAVAEPSVFERRLELLTGMFGLSEVEQGIIALYYVAADGLLSLLIQGGDVIDMNSQKSLASRGHIILGRRKHEVHQALMSRRLLDSGIVSIVDRHPKLTHF